MSVEIHAVISSETIDSKIVQIYNNENKLLMFADRAGKEIQDVEDFRWQNRASPENRIIGAYSINTQLGGQITQDILNGRINQTIQTIKNIVGDFYSDAMIQIKLTGLTVAQVRNLGTLSRTGLRVKNELGNLINADVNGDNVILPTTRSYVDAETILKKYKVNGTIKNLPYSNYDLNNTDGVNCFYQYIKNNYKKIGKKALDKFNKDGVSIQEIKEFAEKYKIKTVIYAIDKSIIYRNECEQSKNHQSMFLIATCGHVAVLKHGNKNSTPMLENKKTDKEINDNEDIIYTKNNKIYTKDGYKLDNNFNEHEMDNALFTGLKPTFSHKDDVVLVKQLMFSHEKIEDVKYEYDMSKAYFNVAYKILDGQYPVFTFDNEWVKYDDNEEISTVYYYLISQKSLELLKEYGVTGNFRTGLLVKLLVDNGLLDKKEIEYVKKPSYLGLWSDVKKRLDNLVDIMVRRILKKDTNVVITEEDIKLAQIDKNYVFYNGLLGKYVKNIVETIYYLPEDEYELLNLGKNEEWTYTGYDDKCIFTRNKTQFKSLNNSTVYNQVVEMTNYVMLKNILHIKKTKGIMPYKIKTDAIGYHKKIKLMPEYEQFFKKPIKDNIFKVYLNYTQTYINGKEIADKIKLEADSIQENISYHGAPGTGKTHTVMNNHKYNFATTTTNVCCLRISNKDIKADTLYSLFQLYNPDNWYKAMKKMAGRTIWIDEYSMVPKFIWNFIYLLCSKFKAKLIVSGDLNQTAPVGEPKFKMDNYFFDKLMGKKEELKKDFRNDEEIIKLRNFVLNSSQRDMYIKFRNLESKKDWTEYDRHLVFTHRCRNYINKTILKKRGYICKYNYEVSKDEKDKKNRIFKSLDVSDGVILSARGTKKADGIYKGDMWKVKHKLEKIEVKVKDEIIYENGYRLVNLDNGATKDVRMSLMQFFQLGFAITTHSAQGLTIREELCIHETKKMILNDPSILYTAITRGTKNDNLNMYYDTKIEQVEEEDLPHIIDEEYNFGQQLKAL